MATAGPTERTMGYLRRQGWLVDKVEQWNPFAGKHGQRKDLYGIIDVLAVRGETTLGVQSTSYSNVSQRIKKLEAHENTNKLLEAGWEIWVMGWEKKGRFWVPRIEELA